MTRQEVGRGLKKFLEVCDECTPRSYSGRGMYGKECVAVVDVNPFQIGLLIGMESKELAEHLLNERCETDGLGLGRIIYWPNIPWPKGEGK